MADTENINIVANKIIDRTLSTLADQKDASQDQILHGSERINAQSFVYAPESVKQAYDRIVRHLQDPSGVSAQRHLIVGPIQFKTRFAIPPDISFGQTSVGTTTGTTPALTVSNYVPFAVHAYVYSFTYVNGEVDGFSIGLYALTPPSTTTTTHNISWIAMGQGSRYNQQDSTNAWSSAYDQNEADFLMDNVAYEDSNQQ